MAGLTRKRVSAQGCQVRRPAPPLGCPALVTAHSGAVPLRFDGLRPLTRVGTGRVLRGFGGPKLSCGWAEDSVGVDDGLSRPVCAAVTPSTDGRGVCRGGRGAHSVRSALNGWCSHQRGRKDTTKGRQAPVVGHPHLCGRR